MWGKLGAILIKASKIKGKIKYSRIMSHSFIYDFSQLPTEYLFLIRKVMNNYHTNV